MTRDEQKAMAQGRKSAKHDAWLWRQTDMVNYLTAYPDYTASVKHWFRGYWLQWAEWKCRPSKILFYHDLGRGLAATCTVAEEIRKAAKGEA